MQVVSRYFNSTLEYLAPLTNCYFDSDTRNERQKHRKQDEYDEKTSDTKL